MSAMAISVFLSRLNCITSVLREPSQNLKAIHDDRVGRRYPITPIVVSGVVSDGSSVVRKMKCRRKLLGAERCGRNKNHTVLMENLCPQTLTRRGRKALSSPRILVSPISRCCQRPTISIVGLHLQSHVVPRLKCRQIISRL